MTSSLGPFQKNSENPTYRIKISLIYYKKFKNFVNINLKPKESSNALFKKSNYFEYIILITNGEIFQY